MASPGRVRYLHAHPFLHSPPTSLPQREEHLRHGTMDRPQRNKQTNKCGGQKINVIGRAVRLADFFAEPALIWKPNCSILEQNK